MKNRRLAALGAAGLLGGWSPLAAQQSTPPATFASTVVVTASLEPQTEERVVATVDVIERREIESRQADLVLDLLRTLPGLAVTQAGSPGKVATLFTRGTSSSQTLVLLDGVVLNDAVLGGFDWSAVATDGVERIEVVRGPFSALWGSNAVGGVVQLVTRAGEKRSASLRLEGGSDEYLRAGLTAAAPVGPVHLDLSGHLRRGDGELDNDLFDSEEGQLRVRFVPSDRWSIGLLARLAEAEIGLPFDFFGTAAPRRRQESASRLLALPIDVRFGSWQVEARLARTDADLELSDPDDSFAASENETRREQARAVVSYDLDAGFWIGGGAEWGRETASTSSAFGPGLDDAHQTTRAAFAQASWSRGALTFDGGVRFDDHSAFGSETSFKGGLVATISAGSRLRASYGESFRAPSLGDLYFPFFGNPELEAERGRSWELGIEGERGPVSAGLTAFENDLEQLIQFDLVRGLPFNIGRARARGVEGRVEGRVAAWRARLDATWLDAEDRDTGAPLPRRPEATVNLLLSWTGERLGAGATLRWVGRREDVGRIELPAHAVVDLAGSWSLREHWSPFARIDNLLDREYEEAAGFPAPGRSWVAGVALRSGG